jgi:very-short-patch-repair endonuclease
MHLRDQQQYRQTVLQLYEKGLLSAQTVLEVFDFDPDVEIERKRYDALQMNALGMGMDGGGGMDGGMGGGFGGFGGGDMGGMPGFDGGGEMGDMGDGGEMGGGEMGGGDAGGAPAEANVSTRQLRVGQIAEPVNPENYGGKILKEKNRSKFDSNQKKTLKKNEEQDKDKKYYPDGQTRDEKGRVIFTEPERNLLDGLVRYVQDGLISYRVVPQFPVNCNGQEYPLDFAIPQLKIAIEADGEMFHSNPKQLEKDKSRDAKLAQMGWTTLRFTETEIKDKIEQVMQTVIKTILKKEMYYQKVKQDLDK